MQLRVLKELVGLKVVKSELVEDYLQVWFEDGECLSVYNQYQFTDSDERPHSHSELTGATLSDVSDDASFIILRFSNGLELSIDMSEDGYLGPEALQLTRPGLPTVVWRPDD